MDYAIMKVAAFVFNGSRHSNVVNNLFARHFHWFQKLTVTVDTRRCQKRRGRHRGQGRILQEGHLLVTLLGPKYSGEAALSRYCPGSIFRFVEGFRPVTAAQTFHSDRRRGRSERLRKRSGSQSWRLSRRLSGQQTYPGDCTCLRRSGTSLIRLPLSSSNLKTLPETSDRREAAFSGANGVSQEQSLTRSMRFAVARGRWAETWRRCARPQKRFESDLTLAEKISLQISSSFDDGDATNALSKGFVCHSGDGILQPQIPRRLRGEREKIGVYAAHGSQDVDVSPVASGDGTSAA